MALIRWRVASFEGDNVIGELEYDDATMLIHTFFYRNVTTQPAYLHVVAANGQAREFDLAAGTEKTVNVPSGQRPTLQDSQVRMGWPSATSAAPGKPTR